MSVIHGGDLHLLASQIGCSPDEIIDFSANLNPLGPPASVASTIVRYASCVTAYPDPNYSSLASSMAGYYGCRLSEVVPGRGATELIYAIPIACPASRALLVVPCYGDYAAACERAGVPTETFPLEAGSGFQLDTQSLSERVKGGDLVFIGRPNNPTGNVPAAEEIRRLCAERTDATFVIDESFIEFSKEPSLLDPPLLKGSIQEGPLLDGPLPANCIVVRSLTKFYAIAGLRLGAAIAPDSLAPRLRAQILPWSIDTLSGRVGEHILQERAYGRDTREAISSLRGNLIKEIGDIPGLRPHPSEANFILVRAEGPIDVPLLIDRVLRHHRIALRPCDNFPPLDESYFRVAVRGESENRLLTEALRAETAETRSPQTKKERRPSTLMFQGTCSNAGKSVLTAALCRILARKGLRIAPFKAQNMSLNSFVTSEGGEIGRAQVLQAQACRISPDCRMNPILLKPSSDTGSQVIVNGRPVGNMDAAEYVAYKNKAFDSVKTAFEELSRDFDAIILEGAGSPAEVNLKQHDIVNMGMARFAQCPVLIAGDIDRGGVFASFVGTFALLDKEEQDLTRGFVINRFRGDGSLLSPAIDITTRYTGKPTLGVVPFLSDLGLPEEDSVSFKERARRPDDPARDVDLVFIDLPHISNFTDADPFQGEPDVRLRVVGSAGELGQPDAIIIPGSKNTCADLEKIKRNGLADAIRNLALSGRTEVVGICGGFQMLGAHIEDCGVECEGERTVEGMGVLPLRTTMNKEKTLTRREGVHLASGLKLSGYEIHHGESRCAAVGPLMRLNDGTLHGAASENGLVFGTYLHGIFDADPFRRWWIDRIRERKGLQPLGRIQYTFDIDSALERLADVVEQALDMQAIDRLMGLP